MESAVPIHTRSVGVATAILVCCAIIVTGLLLRREFFLGSQDGRPRLQPAVREADWHYYTEAGRTLGRPDAPVTVVEFADFECPFCSRFQQYAESLWQLGEDFRVVYRHFPMPNHRFAMPAVRASECAADQGRFAAMHSVLYTHADSFGLVPWSWFAVRAGLDDTVRFAKCVKSSAPLEVLDRDIRDGRRLRVEGTPLLLVGSWRLTGLPPFDTLRSYIRRAAQERSRSKPD